jgi:hypothetical protein
MLLLTEMFIYSKLQLLEHDFRKESEDLTILVITLELPLITEGFDQLFA